MDEMKSTSTFRFVPDADEEAQELADKRPRASLRCRRLDITLTRRASLFPHPKISR
jgi:hypothetical protein